MSAVWMRLRAELRRGRRSLLAITLLVGFGGAIVLGAVAGARRTDSAYPRFLDSARTRHLLVSPAGTSLQGYADEVLRLPEVTDGAKVAGFNVEMIAPKETSIFGAMVAVDERAMREVERPNVLDGRLPDPGDAHEIAINRAMAEQAGLEAGDTITVVIFSDPEERSEPIRLQVAGVIVNTSEVVPVTRFDMFPGIIMTPAAFERWSHFSLAFDGVILRVRPDTDVVAFERTLREIAARHPATGGFIFFADDRGRTELVARALRPQVLALVAFAVVAGTAVLLVMAQVVGRHTLLEAVENPTLRALGMTRAQLVVAAMIRAAMIGAAGAAVAVVVAWLGSPLAPIGPARLAEPNPGLAFDAVALGLGAAGIVVAVCLAVLPRAIVAARVTGTLGVADIGNVHPSRIAGSLSRLTRSVAATAGVRLALEPGRGRSAVPVRSTIAGTLIALLAVSATFTFGASLDRLVSTPRLYGQDWDIVFDIGFGEVPRDVLDEMIAAPDIDAVTGGAYGLLTVAGRQVPAVGLHQLKGDTYPTLLEGRAARAPGEIVLGSTTLERIGAEVGDTVELDRGRATIVGRAVFPQLGQGSFTPTGLGQGAAVPREALEAIDLPPAAYTFAVARVAPGADRAAVLARLTRQCDAISAGQDLCEVVTSQRPPDIGNYGRIRQAPLVLAGLLGGLAGATLAHALYTSVRRRRRDLAILRTIGFVPRQVRWAVSWQATTLTVVALVAGLPLGIAAGRWAWRAFAAELGVAPQVVTPALVLVGTFAGALVLANLVAALPSRAAARTHPAVVLRSE